MSEHDGVTLRAIDWAEIFPWLRIARCFRLAVSLRMLVFGAAGILLTLLGWWFLATTLAKSEDGRIAQWWHGETEQFGGGNPWQMIDHAVPDRPILPLVPGSDATQAGVPQGKMLDPSTWRANDPMFGTWARLTAPVWQIFQFDRMSLRTLLCLGLAAVWSVAVWAFFGAAMTRIAAVEFAVDERVGWGESLRWARTKWFSYFGAPMFPAIVVVAIVLPLAFLGLLMRFTAGAWLVGLLWPLVLVGGLLVVILLLGVVFGWPLMWATISAEGTDSFDALSRVFAYVFHRPLRYLFYAIVAAVIGWLGWLLVANVAVAIIWLAAWAASWGSGDIALANTGLIRFWTGWVKWLAMGYSYAYFWTASTTIYFLLRQDVDATELDEVYREADESEKDFGLPPLATEEEKGEGGAKAEGGRRKAEGGGENAESP